MEIKIITIKNFNSEINSLPHYILVRIYFRNIKKDKFLEFYSYNNFSSKYEYKADKPVYYLSKRENNDLTKFNKHNTLKSYTNSKYGKFSERKLR